MESATGIIELIGRYSINVNAVCPGLIVPSGSEELGMDSFWWVDGSFNKVTPEWREKYTKGGNTDETRG